MEKAKVLMIGPDRSVHGGISAVVNNYYDAGIEEKVQLTYIGTMVEGSKLRKLLQAIHAYIRFCKALPDYPIVHINMASDSSYYRKSFFVRKAKKAGKKIIIHQHGGDFETFYLHQQNDAGRARIQKVLNMADVFLVLAPPWKEFFGKIIEEQKILVFPDAISVPDAFEKEYGKHRILFLGRICREKGVVELLNVMPELHEKYPDVKLLLGGIWEDEEIREQAEHLSEYVTYLGWVDGAGKQDYLTLSDIFVLPTHFEGQSVAILEGMAYYCAIAASNTGGIPQMIESEKNGLLFEPENEEDLRKTLERLLEDAELCKRLGMSGRNTVEKKFAIQNNMNQLVELYHGIL